MPARKLPAVGEKFGEWTFLGEFKGRTWHCRCSCGKEAWPNSCHLRSGASVSCHGRVHIKHNQSESKAYRAWTYIKQRCLNPANDGYKDYGGRGITLHPAWIEDFTGFQAELGEPPSEAHTVERIDNGKGYVPGNIVWATRFEQARNRRNSRWIVIDGIEATLTDWCRFTGVNPTTAHNRMKLYGYTPAQAVGLERKQ